MDTERPHRTTSNNSSTSELFVCFTSRLSASSMKLSSKSILSPSRGRDPPSLSSSLSRRLKSNGSMKGGQASPMFPTGGKRRGCGFENPEPSSPKVTCIGQVRVKTKKQGKKMRARSKRRGEASFRKTEQGFQVGVNPDLTRQNSQSFQYQNHQSLQQECLKHRNQRWVHLPLTICEALREFSCFFPCRSSCMSSEREKEEKGASGVEGGGSGGGEGSCGAAFARWLVTLQDGEGKGRGIELVMEHEGEEEEEEEEEEEFGKEKAERSYSQRRHVFEDIDVNVIEGKKHDDELGERGGGEEEEKAGVSICIPPKNALLLMRCRSDPVKMAALANRFWESPLQKDQVEDEDVEQEEDGGDEKEEQEEEEEEENDQNQDRQHVEMENEEQHEQVERNIEEDNIFERETTEASVVISEEEYVARLIEEAEAEAEAKAEVNESYEIGSRTNTESSEFSEAKEEKDEEATEGINHHQGENFSCISLPEPRADLYKSETEDPHLQESEEKNQKERENNESTEPSSSSSTFIASEPENEEAKEGSTEEEEEKVTEKVQAPNHQVSDPNKNPESKERENESKNEERETERLPECLLLMMCEPKLSMEVSKETWVCSTDFIRWLPERPAGKHDGKRVSVDSSSSKPKLKPKLLQPLMQPPRSSCSLPAAGGVAGMSMATMIEQKLVGSKSQNGYEPFVLTRCKSEPMRSSAKLAPEPCFWNNRKLEPHPPTAQLGVGAPAGVGF